MARKICECSEPDAREKKTTERVGKPTAWGHVHEQKKVTYTCQTCGGYLPNARTELTMLLYAPPDDDN